MELELTTNQRRWRMIWHIVFTLLQIACLAVIIRWHPYDQLPSPGYAIAWIAVAAAAMSVHEGMHVWQKALWLILVACLLRIELRAIRKDKVELAHEATHQENEQAESFRNVQNEQAESFAAVLNRQETDYKSTHSDLSTSITKLGRLEASTTQTLAKTQALQAVASQSAAGIRHIHLAEFPVTSLSISWEWSQGDSRWRELWEDFSRVCPEADPGTELVGVAGGPDGKPRCLYNLNGGLGPIHDTKPNIDPSYVEDLASLSINGLALHSISGNADLECDLRQPPRKKQSKIHWTASADDFDVEVTDLDLSLAWFDQPGINIQLRDFVNSPLPPAKIEIGMHGKAGWTSQDVELRWPKRNGNSIYIVSGPHLLDLDNAMKSLSSETARTN